MPLFYLFQGINVLVIDTAVQGAVKGPDHHDFRALPVVYRHSPVVQHPVMTALKLNAVSAIYSPFIEHGKNQIDFFIRRLCFKHGFGTMNGK